jgi:4-diphosphocytidyl-2C-methyl-D-erythritol kinase
MTRIVLSPCAKINIYLRVLGRRPDGYHEIDSVLQTIACTTSVLEAAGSRTLRSMTLPFPACLNSSGAAKTLAAAHRPGGGRG